MSRTDRRAAEPRPWGGAGGRGGRTAVDKIGEGGDGAAVGGHTDVLEDEGAVQEEDVVGVRVKHGVERRAGSGVGGGAEGLADVDRRARHGRVAEGLPQEVDVRDLVIRNLHGKGLHSRGVRLVPESLVQIEECAGNACTQSASLTCT